MGRLHCDVTLDTSVGWFSQASVGHISVAAMGDIIASMDWFSLAAVGSVSFSSFFCFFLAGEAVVLLLALSSNDHVYMYTRLRAGKHCL